MLRFLGVHAILIAFSVVNGMLSQEWKRNIAREANCAQGLDILFVQDTTGSLQYHLTKMTSEIVGLLSEIEESFVHTRAGVVQFKDKPIDPMGVPSYDYCYRMSQPLTSNLQAVRDAYASYDASGGGDLPEASYHALWDVVHDARIGWRPFAKTDELRPDVTAARIVVMLTDAQPHFEGSLTLPKFPGTSRTEAEFEKDCLEHDYPSPQAIKEALDGHRALLVSLIARDPSIDAFGAWSWVNLQLMNQPEEFCSRVADGAVDLKERILNIFRLIKAEIPCQETTTSTTTTTTTPTTTTTTTPTTTTTTTTTTPTTTMPPTTTTTTPPTTTHDEATTSPSTASDASHCGCHCGCGCGCGCAHKCSGGSAHAPQFVFNIPPGVVSADVSVRDIPEGLANLPAL